MNTFTKRPITLTLASTALAVLASSCASEDPSSGAEGSAYCTSYASSESAFRDMAAGDIGSFVKAFDLFHDLAAQSPSTISAEWKTLDGAFVTLEEALDEAGMSVAQLDAVVSEGTVPEGVDTHEMQWLLAKLERFASADFADAATAIEQYGLDECDVDLTS